MSKVKLGTFENNNMSLSCKGVMTIEDGEILEIEFKGMPRAMGDSWVQHYRNRKSNKISEAEIQEILSYDGEDNVVSFLRELKDEFGESYNGWAKQ